MKDGLAKKVGHCKEFVFDFKIEKLRLPSNPIDAVPPSANTFWYCVDRDAS